MISRHLRFAFFGGLLGLLVALTPGCQKKCAVDTCAGCCTEKNECVTDTSATQCGVAGASCSSCATDQVCTDGACATLVVIVEDAGVDAGPPPCTNDFACGPGKICNAVSGECVMGSPCNEDYECQSMNSEDRCYQYGQQCTCDKTPNGGGTCRLRKGPCEECTVLPDGGGAHFECGEDVVIFGPPGIGAGRCKTLPNDMTGKKFCSYQRVGQCACGTIDDGTGFCRPQSNSCESVGCNLDKDCPSGAVCSVNRPDAGANACGGVCVPRCRWDFAEKREASPGCPPGLTCWVDSANLNADSIYYGAGRCKPPCAGNADCQPSGGNPFGGTNLKCEGELLDDGTRSPKRCRANGACMDTAECEELRDAGPYIGYCDRGSFVCRSDCRTGTDPLTGTPFTDCRPPFSCNNNAGVNFCKLETCKEQGGAGIACAQGEYCCGDDKNFDGTPDPCPPLAQQNPAGCYKAPTPPFCTECGAGNDFSMGVDSMVQAMADQECAAQAAPSWAPCANGSKSPNCSPLIPKCQYAGDRAPMMAGIAVCMLPSVNDVGTVLLRYGETPKAQIACPTNYSVSFVRPQPNPSQGVGYCNTNADCSVLTDGGVSDAGVCEPDPLLRQMDGGLLKACRCDAKSGAAQCPNGTAPIGEVRSFCKDGVTGSRQYCIETAVCTPPRGSVYKATTEFGCGL
ncbi:MAG: hypothetical protein Q8K32_18985 [Archangium sp.]|nr:hypothetical protein [Archangium sp.]